MSNRLTAPDLLDLLTQRSVRLLTRNGSSLRYEAPAGAMTPELLAALKANKAELLALLAAESPPAEGDHDANGWTFSAGRWYARGCFGMTTPFDQETTR